MQHLLYDELVPFYRLLDPTEHHLDEASIYEVALRRALDRTGARGMTPTLLELGAGAGNNAYHLKHSFECTLTDPSEAMRGLSRELNPECIHLSGDMRTLRLSAEDGSRLLFDAVLAHDAIVYMTSEQDVRAALTTIFEHLKPGGAAIVAPDCTRESFVESSDSHHGISEDGVRELRCLEWNRDGDPSDCVYEVHYAFLLRDGDRVRAVHDRHREGLFRADQWTRWLEETGFVVTQRPRLVEEGSPYVDFYFLAERPLE